MIGKFISIEGIDASGKADIGQKAAERLQEKGYKVIFINKKNLELYSPYIKKFMSNIKKSLWENKSDDPVDEVKEEEWLYLHTLWYQMMQNHLIVKLLKENDFVILDGWYYKFLARHLVNGDFDFDYTYSIINRLIQCDKVFLIDADPEVCWSRRKEFKPSEMGKHSEIKSGSEHDRFITYQSNVRDKYLEFSKNYNWNIVKGNEVDVYVAVDKVVNMILEQK